MAKPIQSLLLSYVVSDNLPALFLPLLKVIGLLSHAVAVANQVEGLQFLVDEVLVSLLAEVKFLKLWVCLLGDISNFLLRSHYLSDGRLIDWSLQVLCDLNDLCFGCFPLFLLVFQRLKQPIFALIQRLVLILLSVKR